MFPTQCQDFTESRSQAFLLLLSRVLVCFGADRKFALLTLYMGAPEGQAPACHHHSPVHLCAG